MAPGFIAPNSFFLRSVGASLPRTNNTDFTGLLQIKHAIRSIALTAARELVARVISLSSSQAIRAEMQDHWRRCRPVLSPDVTLQVSGSSSPRVTHNENAQRFEAHIDEEYWAFLRYALNGDRVIFEDTFVPKELRSKGIAASLARTAFKEARQRGWRVVVRCSYLAVFVERNPEFADLLEKEESNNCCG